MAKKKALSANVKALLKQGAGGSISMDYGTIRLVDRDGQRIDFAVEDIQVDYHQEIKGLRRDVRPKGKCSKVSDKLYLTAGKTKLTITGTMLSMEPEKGKHG